MVVIFAVIIEAATEAAITGTWADVQAAGYVLVLRPKWVFSDPVNVPLISTYQLRSPQNACFFRKSFPFWGELRYLCIGIGIHCPYIMDVQAPQTGAQLKVS